jgi:hypothetical protein
MVETFRHPGPKSSNASGFMTGLRKGIAAGPLGKRELPRQELEEQDAEAEDVRRPANVLEQALFRRDVRVRPDDARGPLRSL